MRRLFMILFALFLLTACLPTPKQEFVVNKGDNTVEQKLNATSKPAKTDRETNESEKENQPQMFPDRWDAEPVEVLKDFTIAAHADVITKADGLYPVYQSAGKPFSKEDITAIASRILGEPVESGEAVMTKTEWGAAMQSYLDEVADWERWVAAGKPNDGIDRDESGFTAEEIEATTNWYMEQIRNAPDETSSAPTVDFSGIESGTPSVFTMEDGTKAWIFAYPSSVTVSRTDRHGYIYDRNFYAKELEWGDPNAKLWHDVTLSKDAAESILNRELERLSMQEFSVKYAIEANLFSEAGEGGDTRYETNGWSFVLHRNPGNYPASKVNYAPASILKYGEGAEFLVNKAIGDEQIKVLISEQGLQYFEYSNPKEITGLPNQNIELLPFEEIQDRVLKTLTMCFPIAKFREMYPGQTIPIEIYEMLLTTYTVREKGENGYYEMPCWIVFFDGYYDAGPRSAGVDEEKIVASRNKDRAEVGLQHECLILNAVDGSIIHTDYGY